MFNKKIEYLADMIVESDRYDSVEKDIIVYGLTSAVEQVAGILTTVVLGVFFGLLLESFVFLVSFSMIRMYAGGYHCEKPTHCYAISCGIMIAVLGIVKFTPMANITLLSVILLLIAVPIILKFAPVGAANKPLDDVEKKHYRKRTLFYLGIECCMIFILFIIGMQNAAFVICLGIAITSFLIIAQKIMKKTIKKLGITLMILSLLSSATRVTSFANEINDPFAILEQHGFQIITSSSTYSLNTFDADDIETNLLFDQQSFSSALSSQSEFLNETIYNGNIIAVFDDSNEAHHYEESMGLPLGFESVETSTEDTHKSIGYIYQTDDFGGVHITRVNTEIGMDLEEENKNAFVDVLLNYEIKNPANGVQARAGLNTEFLGSVTDYYYGSDNKGDVSVAYEVSTAQGVDNYDYYAVHAYIDATPGDSLYGNKYDADVLTTSLKTTTSGATLYKTGPNTLSGTTSYTVDLGFTGSQDGISGSANFSWNRDIPDVDIDKSVKSSTECEWEVDIDDWDSAADDTLSFEPGGTFRVGESNNKLTIYGRTKFTVDAWDESPSTAVSDTTIFYCSDSSVE